MARKPKEPTEKPELTREEELISEARKFVDDNLTLDSHNRVPALDDLRMKVGEDHWKDGDVDFKKERRDEGRPAIEFNRLPGLSSQVIGDLRENLPSCQVHPADSQASIDFATYYEGRIRQIEADCNADTIYDTGAQQVVDGGFGNWRVVTDYIHDDTFDQTARLEPIENQFAVIWDALAQRWDKTDARAVAVIARIHKDRYKREFKGKDPASFETDPGGNNWYLNDTYTVCEYIRKEPAGNKHLYQIPGADIRISDEVTAKEWVKLAVTFEYMLDMAVDSLPPEFKDVWPKLMEEGFARERTIKRTKIVRYLLSGHEILEDAQEWVSDKYWPIVPVDGKITNIDGEIWRKGVLRDAKGAQKAYNFAWNVNLEDLALSPRMPYWLTPTQAKGHEKELKKMNKSNRAYQLFNPDPQNPGVPQRTVRLQASTAISEIAMRAVDDMRAMTNVFDPSMMQLDPDISGVAARTRISRSGVANFEIVDNVARSRGLTWRILLDILPKIEDTKREVPTRDLNGAVKFEKINWPNKEMKEGTDPVLKDLSKAGNYNVTVTVGPSYPTQRMESVDVMTKITQGIPELWSVLGDEILRNMDYPGAQKMRLRLMASMVIRGQSWLFNEEEMKELLSKYPQLEPKLQPPPPDPVMVARLQKEWAQGVKFMAEAEKTVQETGKLKTETVQGLMAIIDRMNGILSGASAGQNENPQQRKAPANV